MSDVTIYHNPACSKSRQTLALIEDHGITPAIIRYLDAPPSAEVLASILQMLGISPRELLRKGEAEYKTLGLADAALTDELIIAAMVTTPRLIERPIVVRGNRAVLGRPPENVLDLLRD